MVYICYFNLGYLRGKIEKAIQINVKIVKILKI